MSAKGRGLTSIKNDNYPTPPWVVRRLLEAVPWVGQSGEWLEPACGEGAILDALGGNACWTLYDLEVTGHDYLKQPAGEYDGAITNPPYTIAFEFAKKMTDEANDTFLLARLGLLESAKRADWLRENPPAIYVLPDRPSYAHRVLCERGHCKGYLVPWCQPETHPVCFACAAPAVSRSPGTDASGYAWFHWGERSDGRVHILKATPASERVDRVVPTTRVG